MSHYQLDARGLLCPLPVIRAQDRVGSLSPGDTLEVLSSDPGAISDIPSWCRVHGHSVLDIRENEDLREYRVTLRVEAVA